ncbi:MAG: IS66 family insertion sequence element accessory protein TnpB [bacterium]|nr:IS66 family insertion sequence element accessory protein TnpB [bacterium]
MKLALPSTILIATTPIDLRLSFDRLAGLVRDELGRDPGDDLLVVFHNRRRTHLKLLWRDSGGYWIGYRRLDRGTFRIPVPIPSNAKKVRATERELRVLLKGIDLSLVRAARRTARRAS